MIRAYENAGYYSSFSLTTSFLYKSRIYQTLYSHHDFKALLIFHPYTFISKLAKCLKKLKVRISSNAKTRNIHTIQTRSLKLIHCSCVV